MKNNPFYISDIYIIPNTNNMCIDRLFLGKYDIWIAATAGNYQLPVGKYWLLAGKSQGLLVGRLYQLVAG